MPANPLNRVAIAKPVDDHAWRGRVTAACGVLSMGVMALAAVNLDWTMGPAMVLGQLTGVAAPLLILALGVWGVTAFVGRKG